MKLMHTKLPDFIKKVEEAGGRYSDFCVWKKMFWNRRNKCDVFTFENNWR